MGPQLDHDQRPFTGTERLLARTKACAFFWVGILHAELLDIAQQFFPAALIVSWCLFVVALARRLLQVVKVGRVNHGR